jgi:hypothetical protein
LKLVQRAEGTFEVAGLAPGEHRISLRADGRRLVEGAVRTFEVRAGETRDVPFDLSAVMPSEVSVRVTANGALVVGAEVRLDQVGAEHWSRFLGRTDADGVARGHAPAGRTVLAIASEGERCLGRSAPITLAAGPPMRVELDAAVGDLVLQFPRSLVVPEDGRFALSLVPLDGAAGSEHVEWHSLTGATASSAFGHDGLMWRAPRVELGRIATGRYRVQLEAWSLDEPTGFAEEQIVPPLEREIEVRRGEVCTIVVPGD